MYIVGKEEAEAVRKVLLSGKLFRYHKGGECTRFEERYAKYLDVKYARMTSSGTTALTAAFVGLNIGPGDEVLVPACTYMASVVAVLAAGAIPVVVDVDDTITIDPRAIEKAIGPRTRAILPVHMWGLSCDMDAIMRIARRRKLLVVEDACQAVGGGYKGRMLGAIGHAGGFSFNFYKNMTCGEGGAFVSNQERVMKRGSIMVDCCGFYWNGRDRYLEHFTSNGARASEIEGALLNVQLDRLPGMIRAMRKQKKRILRETAGTGLIPIRANSLDHECGSHVMFTFATAEKAVAMKEAMKAGFITANTGRHIYTEWDQVFAHRGGSHPALNPFNLKENKHCRMRYTKTMCAKSLDILGRTVAFTTHPKRTDAEVTAFIRKLKDAARVVLGR